MLNCPWQIINQTIELITANISFIHITKNAIKPNLIMLYIPQIINETAIIRIVNPKLINSPFAFNNISCMFKSNSLPMAEILVLIKVFKASNLVESILSAEEINKLYESLVKLDFSKKIFAFEIFNSFQYLII